MTKNYKDTGEKEMSLLHLLHELSRTCACQATNQTLTARLGCSDSTCDRLLAALEDHGHIVRVTTPAAVRNGEIVRKRFILLVSDLNREFAARVLATFVKERKKPVPCVPSIFESIRDYADFLGPLRCTLEQFHEWLTTAIERGYLVRENERGLGSYVPGPTPCERAYLRTQNKWEPRNRAPPLKDRINAYLRDRRGIPCTLKQVADALGYSRTRVREAAKKIEGLYEWRERNQVVLSLAPRAAISDFVVDILLSDGPQTTIQLQKRLGYKPRLANHKGVVQTRFGNVRVWSAGPLPDGYRARIKEEQRSRKSLANQDYYRTRPPARMPRDYHRIIAEFTMDLLARQPEIYGLPARYLEIQAVCTPDAIEALYKELRIAGIERYAMPYKIRERAITLYEAHLKTLAAAA